MSAGDPPPLITECPNCHTRFRVGESQLQMAHGRVRCGACLAVFAGVDHLLLDESQTPPPVSGEDNALDSVLAELAFDTPGSQSSADDERHKHHRSADDWTSVSVDTQEFSRDTDETIELPMVPSETLSGGVQADAMAAEGDSERRVTIEDALNDEQALRWWLEDELPSEQHPGGVPGDADDGMVVQLSQLDSVADEELDLQSLVGEQQASGDSTRALEALFDELPEEDGLPEVSGRDSATPPAETEDASSERSNAVHERSAEAALERLDPADTQDLDAELPDLDALEFADSEELEISPPPLPPLPKVDESSEVAPETASSAIEESLDTMPESPPGGLAERTAEQLQDAIDEAEPLVTRAMADVAARSSGPVELVEPPRRPPEPQVEPAESVAAESAESVAAEPAESVAAEPAESVAAEPAESVAAEPAKPVAAEPAEAIAAEPAAPMGPRSAEPRASEPVQDAPTDAASWNSASFPETPAELVEGISEEMAAAGQPVVEEEPGFGERLRGSIDGFWGHAMALRAATALAFVLLTAQILYWQFDDWSKTSTLRPLYAAVCSVVGCELPLRRSVRELQSRKLAVRSHPDKADALLVDALIINEAEFEQPFPVIELQFMDLQQQLVGSYRLEPSAYLDGELAGSTALMAVRTPIHIDIDIPDPGPRAVNYQLQFR